MSAIDRLIEAAARVGADFGMWTDQAQNTQYRAEVRVFGEGDARFIERGATLYEAAAKAADRLDESEKKVGGVR